MTSIAEVSVEKTSSIIKFSGFIDAATIENMKEVIDASLPAKSKQVIIDLEKVEFLDSHGIGFFVSLLKKVHSRNGKLIFAGANGQPLSVLNMVGFNNSLVTYALNTKQALSLFEE